MKSRMYQSVVITLNDGTIHCFTGPAIFKEGEERKIRNIEFTLPKELPSDTHFERLAAKSTEEGE